jgi:hypothetical protein
MPKCRPIPKLTKMADTEISAETDTETDNFVSLSICLNVVSMETLDLNTFKKLVSTVQKIRKVSKSLS